MVTHRDKKPFQCSYQDCDKSYCDMRSLRRHLENHHATEANSNSGTPTTGSPSRSANDKPINTSSAHGVSIAEQAGSPRNCNKASRGRTGKDKRTGGDLLQVSGYDSGKSSGRSTPGSVHDTKTSDVTSGGQNCVSSRERNSDSFSSGGSEDMGENAGEQNPHPGSQEPLKPKSAVDLLKQAAERVQEHRVKQSTSETWQERIQQHPYMVYHPDGMSYQQWYPAAVYSQDPRLVYQYHPGMMSPQVYQFGASAGVISDAQNMHGQAMPGRMMTENEACTEMMKTSGAGHGVQTTPSPSQEFASTEALQAAFISQQGGRAGPGTPTNAMAIALATAKGQIKFSRESYYGIHPSGTQWQQVSWCFSE